MALSRRFVPQFSPDEIGRPPIILLRVSAPSSLSTYARPRPASCTGNARTMTQRNLRHLRNWDSADFSAYARCPGAGHSNSANSRARSHRKPSIHSSPSRLRAVAC